MAARASTEISQQSNEVLTHQGTPGAKEMKDTRYHTIIIGAGSGGLTVAAGLSALGKKTALIEAAHVGGDCTNVGCIPSKALIHLVNSMNTNGMTSAEILKAVQEKRNSLRDLETEETKEIPNLDFIEGCAKLSAKNRVEVQLTNGEKLELSAKNIVLATGAKPLEIPVPGLPKERTLTNLSMFEQTEKPEHFAIVGSGVIGTEMAFAFSKLGSKVSMISLAPRVLERMDSEASNVIGESLSELGVDFHLGSLTDHYDEATKTLFVKQGEQLKAIEGVDKVLLAIGRIPATKGIGLEDVGVEVTRQGIVTDGYGGTNVKGIYAIGDITTSSNFTHSANAQGRRLVQRLAFPFLPRLAKEPEYPSATFSDPEVGTVGPSLEELHKKYHPKLIKTVRFELSKTDKGFTQDLDRGFVQLHVVRLTGKILGATIVAPKASEMISLITAHMMNGLSIYKLANLIFPYPVLGHGIKKAADTFVFGTLAALPKEFGAYLNYRWAKPTANMKQKQSKVKRPRVSLSK